MENFDPLATDNHFHVAIKNRESGETLTEWDEGPEALLDAILSVRKKRMDVYYDLTRTSDAPDLLQFTRQYAFLKNKTIKDITADDYSAIWNRFLYELENRYELNVDPIDPPEEGTKEEPPETLSPETAEEPSS